VARNTQSFENDESYRRNVTERSAALLESISGAIESLARQFGTVVERLETGNQAGNRKRRDYERDELKWTIRAFIAGGAFSVVSLILSGLTLAVLVKTLGVYRGQATIMATQSTISRDVAAAATQANKLSELGLMAEVGVSQAIARNDDVVLTFTNTGHSKALNVVVHESHIITPEPKVPFDPFTFRDTLFHEQLRQIDKEEDAMIQEQAATYKAHMTTKQWRERVAAVKGYFEPIRNDLKMDWEKDKIRDTRPPEYVDELVAGGSADHVTQLRGLMGAHREPAFIFGTYSYEDELRHLHSARFCYRYSPESGVVSSCLIFRERTASPKSKNR